MKYLKYILTFIAICFVTSCSLEELHNPVSSQNYDKVTVVGRVTNFSDYNVETRGTKDADEGYISKITMAIFPVNNDGKTLAGKCVYYIPNQESTSFTFDRSNFTTGGRYAIFVFANIDMPTFENNDAYKELSLDDLLSISYNVTGVGIPETGFPMIGSLGDTFSSNPDKDNKVFIMRPESTGEEEPAPTVNGQSESLLQIPMSALYAKVNFIIEVDANQTIQGNNPQFILSKCEIVNVSNIVSFDHSLNKYDKSSEETNAFETPFMVDLSSGNIAEDNGSEIELTFYVPERLVTPATTSEDYPYPFIKGNGNTINSGGTIRDEDRSNMQRFKPRLLDKDGNKQISATNVVLTGRYRDHQNHYYDVSYTIYLGSDNYANFDVKRNGEYNNIITIKGLTNSSDKTGDNETISLDHRVNVTRSQPAIIDLRREVLLDSHFEVRPLRIRSSGINDEGLKSITHVQVNITDVDWMRLERSFGDGTLDGSPTNSVGTCIYIDDENSPSYGKRRYFTHNLITGVNQVDYDYPLSDDKHKTVVVPIKEAEECIWIYVDECTESGDDVRSGTIQLTYGTLNGTEFIATQNESYPPIKYVINQRKLFHVKNGEHEYDIEYHEEYLYNFDANDAFGQTEFEGMPWGLDGAQLSFDKKAVVFDSGEAGNFWGQLIRDIIDSIVNSNVEAASPFYDFYIDKYDSTVMPDASNRSDRNGYQFCLDIINDINTKDNDNRDTGYDEYINIRDMATQPASAIEYCYNKNKRNNDGSIAEVNWYLPAIDEIEDIVMSSYLSGGEDYPTYARFKEFQNKYYWSCQPAYSSNLAHYANYAEYEGYVYMDYKANARATKVVYNDGIPQNITSGASGYEYIILFNNNETTYYNVSEQLAGGQASFEYEYEVIKLWGQNTRKKTISRSDMIRFDEGHQPRAKYNRVRCVRN